MADKPGQLQLAVLMFTDIVNSVSLQKKLGTTAYTHYISRHDEIFKACLSQAPGARILNETGDGFLVRFNSSRDAVDAALRLQYLLHNEICEGESMSLRIGLHSGEITEMHEGLRGETRAVGMAINLAARIMDLAISGQILMTRAVFDDARQFTRHYPEIDGIESAGLPPLLWPAYGRYIFKGNDEPMEIYGVGAEGITPLDPPEGSEKAKRAVAADEEATLGWRPGVGLEIPRREDWVIEKKIGEGGFGEVWLAENKKSGVQRVFKFCFDPDRLRSFKRELTLFRLLQDALGNRRDIAALYEVSVEAPPYYLESEYVPTGNISQWFETKGGIEKVGLKTRLEIISKSARAVAAAHSVGIIHKDIKPSNILIAEANGLPEPRLSDFGIGALSDPSRLRAMGITSGGFTESVVLESDGSNSFTRLYAPPEYLVGKPASVRGDIYSLGVMLYQLAVGDLNRPLGTGWRRGIEDDLLADDIRRCVDVDPEHRFQSAAHLAEHLEHLDDRHAEKAEELRMESLKQLAERRWRTTFLTLSVVLGLAILAALLGKGFLEQREAKEVARNQTEEANQQKSKADRQRMLAVTATEQVRTQASQSDFLLAGQLLQRDHRSEALAYLARAVERDPRNFTAARKLMATLAMSHFVPLRLPPIETLPAQTASPVAKDVSPDGTLLAALAESDHGPELRVWKLSGSTVESEILAWNQVDQSESVLEVAFVSNTALCFVTLSKERRESTLHVWGRAPKWGWIKSYPLGEFSGFGGFLADGAIWAQQQPGEAADAGQRFPRPGGPRQDLIFLNTATGEETRLESPRGQIIAMEGIIRSGALGAVVAVHQTNRDSRVVSAWSTTFKPDESAGREPPPGAPPRGRRPSRRSARGPWREYWRGSPWSGPPLTIAVSPDGARAAVPEPGGSVHVWSLTDFNGYGNWVTTLPKANDLAIGLRFTPDSKRLAVGYFGNSVVIYGVISGNQVLGPLAHEGGVMGIEISGDGVQLLTRSLDQTSRLWDASTGAPLSEPMRHNSYVIGGFFSEDGKTAVSIGYDGVVKVWNLAGGSAQGESLTARDDHRISSISPDWNTLFTTTSRAMASESQAVIPFPSLLSDATTERAKASKSSDFEGFLETRQRVLKGSAIAAAAHIDASRFTTGSETLIAVCVDGRVVVRSVGSNTEETFQIGAPGTAVRVHAISGDGSTIAVSSRDQLTRQRGQMPLLSVWRREGSAYRKMKGIPNDERVTVVAFNDDGSRMVTSTRQLLQGWERNAAGDYVNRAISRLSVTSALAMNRAGTRFLVGSAEGTLQSWSFEGEPLTRPLKQSGPVIAVAFAADEQLAAAAAASLDENETARVQVWDLSSQESLSPPARFFGGDRPRRNGSPSTRLQQTLSGSAATVSFSPDISQILLAYRGDTVVWDLAPALYFDDTSTAVPEIIPQLAKAIGGSELRRNSEAADAMDVLATVPYEKTFRLRAKQSDRDAGKSQSLQSLQSPQSPQSRQLRQLRQLRQWAGWLLADPSKRAIAPMAETTEDRYSDYLIEQQTTGSLREALIRNPNSSQIAAFLAARLLAHDDTGVRPPALDEATWFADMGMDFLKLENARQSSVASGSNGPENIRARSVDSGYRDVARAYQRIGQYSPGDARQEGFYHYSLVASALALEHQPDDLGAWFDAAGTLRRIARLHTDDQETEKATACQMAALPILALLNEADYPAARRELGETVAALTGTPEPGEISGSDGDDRRSPMRNPALTDYLQTLSPDQFSSAMATIPELPVWLAQSLLFYLRDAAAPEVEGASRPPLMWMQRAFAQAAMGKQEAALAAANRALGDGINSAAATRRIQKLRAKTLFAQGDIEDARKAFAIGEGITQRPVEATDEMIDLTGFYTAGLQQPTETESARGAGRPSLQPEFGIRPGILTSLQGIRFDTRGLILPGSSRGSGRTGARARIRTFTREPRSIPVRQTARRIHFLHGALVFGGGAVDSLETIGEYVIHFDDGSTQSIPLRSGIEIGNWKPSPEEIPAAAADGSGGETLPMVAWAGAAGTHADAPDATLFLTTWENPNPAGSIASIDFVDSGPGAGRPFLVAITVEP